MKSLPKLIRSFWLVALLALFGLCSTTSTPGMTVPAIAHDEGALPTIAYDVPSLSVFDYDVAPALPANERERRGAETSGVFAGFSSFPAAETTVARNPNVYEAFFEAPISGTTRTSQRASANDFLATKLQNDAQLSGMFNQELGGNVLQHMESGSGGSYLNPLGTVWHHPFDNPDVLQLLRRSEHTNPSLQPILHPNGRGGYANYYGP